MRTTLVIDDELMQRAKAAAALRNLTVSRLVEEALRAALRPSQPVDQEPYRTITFGGPSGATVPQPLDPAELKRLLEDEDIERLSRG